MGMDGNAEFVFDNRSRTSFLEQFPGIYTSSAPVQPAARSMSISREAAPPPAMKPASHQLCPSVDIPEQLLVGDWDPLMSSAHHHPSFTAGLLHSQGVHYSSVGLVDEQIRAIPCFSSTGCPEVISSYTSTSSGLPSVHAGRADLLISGDHQVARDSKRKKRTLQESTGFDSYPQMNKMQNTDDDDDDDDSEHLKGGLPDAAEKDDKKLKSEEKPGAGSRKANAKHGGKEQPATNSEGKQDYIHVRAKRGQATNSHSLAERVRREKISERMRYLQNLVPGCNKITGKAVMLDEIINYVQSLQRQVEFLSMKLATVNPELNFDIDQILSKDMLHLRRGSSSSLGFGLALNSSQHLANGYLPPQLLHPELMMTNMTGSEELLKHVLPHIPPFAQTQGLWDHELQNAIQMGFLPNISVGTELPSNNQEHHNAKM